MIAIITFFIDIYFPFKQIIWYCQNIAHEFEIDQ